MSRSWRIVRGGKKIWISRVKLRRIPRHTLSFCGGQPYVRRWIEERYNERVWRLQLRRPFLLRYWT